MGQPETKRPHVSRGPSTKLKRLGQQPGAGRFTVGPGDARHGQRLRWRAEETIGDEAGALTQLWNSGNKDTGPEVGFADVGSIFIQDRARPLGHRLLRELKTVIGPSLTGEKQTARPNRLAIECHVIHDDIGGDRGEADSQLGERPRHPEAFELDV